MSPVSRTRTLVSVLSGVGIVILAVAVGMWSNSAFSSPVSAPSKPSLGVFTVETD